MNRVYLFYVLFYVPILIVRGNVNKKNSLELTATITTNK